VNDLQASEVTQTEQAEDMSLIQKGIKNILSKSPKDVVILSALRTSVTRANKGGFRDTYDHQLLAAVLKAILVQNPQLDPAKVDDLQIGTVLSELGGSKAGRMATLHTGYSSSSSFQTVNRACSSGLSAITGIAHAISLGQIDAGIGGGMESMTQNYGSRAIPTALWKDLKESNVKSARDCILGMGLTAENIVDRYGVSRIEQDEFALRSHQKAHKAQRDGLFDTEVVAVEVTHGPESEKVIISKDDGIRANSTLAKLSTMKPAFRSDGTVTAGNSSQISDGAAAVLMMRRSTATALGLTSSVIGKWVSTVTTGCQPDEMGIGPVKAIPKLLDYTGLQKEEVGIWEINEAFACQAVYSIRELGIDEQRVNPKGGAIAIGHPLGATGARQVATLLPELERQGEQIGVVSMCVGTGMGVASLFVRE
jgi:acetyl-CoA acyltransferase 1